MKKNILWVAIFSVIIIALLCQICGVFEFMGIFPPSLNAMEKKYQKSENEISLVCRYLLDSNFEKYDVVRIDVFDSTKKIECLERDNVNGGYKKGIYELSDEKIISCIETLQKTGFDIILKEYNYIYFEVWGSFGTSVGLVYSPHGKPHLSEINAKKQILEKLKYQDWYYNKTIYN